QPDLFHEHCLEPAQHRSPAILPGQLDEARTDEEIDAADIGEHHIAGVVEVAVEIDVARDAAKRQEAFFAQLVAAARTGGQSHSRQTCPDIYTFSIHMRRQPASDWPEAGLCREVILLYAA